MTQREESLSKLAKKITSIIFNIKRKKIFKEDFEKEKEELKILLKQFREMGKNSDIKLPEETEKLLKYIKQLSNNTFEGTKN